MIRLFYKLTARFRKHEYGTPFGKVKMFGQKSHLVQCQKCGCIAWFSVKSKSMGKVHGCDMKMPREERERLLKEFNDMRSNIVKPIYIRHRRK